MHGYKKHTSVGLVLRFMLGGIFLMFTYPVVMVTLRDFSILADNFVNLVVSIPAMIFVGYLCFMSKFQEVL